MKIYLKLLLISSLLVFCTQVGQCIKPQPVVVEVKKGEGPGGFWQEKVQWKAHWVKNWETRTIWVPVWRKVWGPVETREWLPFPKPNPAWNPNSHPQPH